MANLSGRERALYVQEMFARIAGRYDLMNRLMTGGQDVRWRRLVIQRAALPPGGRLLDLGAGTGDLAREALRQIQDCSPYPVDFTLRMMQVGREKMRRNGALRELNWTAADALHLPFPDGVFDAVVSAFLMRNLSDVRASLSEQRRVLKPGGRIVILDTTPPAQSILLPLVRFHLRQVIPALGRWVAGQSEAYHYLPDSTEGFLEPEQMAARLSEAGFTEVAFERLMAGTVAIHWGRK